MRAVLNRYVHLHNQGVDSGDFSALIELFHSEAEMRFDGIPVGPFLGREAILVAFQENPPDDHLVLLESTGAGDAARYGWRARSQALLRPR